MGHNDNLRLKSHAVKEIALVLEETAMVLRTRPRSYVGKDRCDHSTSVVLHFIPTTPLCWKKNTLSIQPFFELRIRNALEGI